MNNVQLIGNLTRDPELKQAGESSVCTFTIAVGQKQYVQFINCKSWKGTAENIAQFFKKGDKIAIDGQLTVENWEKEGQKQSKMIVTARAFHFLNSKNNSSQSEQSQDLKSNSAYSNNNSSSFNDDLPF